MLVAYYKLGAFSDITLLGDGVYGLENGFGDQKPGNGDGVKLRLGGIVIGSLSQKIAGDIILCLPSLLEGLRLTLVITVSIKMMKVHTAFPIKS